MKKKIAIMLTLLLAAGTFTACRLEEKSNNNIQTSVVTTADVSVYSESSESTSTLPTTEITHKSTISKETELSEKDTKSKEKSDSGQDVAVVSATEPRDVVENSKSENKPSSKEITPKQTEKLVQKAAQPATQKPTQKPTQPPMQKPTEKPTQKSTQPSAKAKTVDVNSAVNSAISYGKQLGMKYDSSLNTGNASWFSPTNASYYDSTLELTADLKSDVEYVAYYYQSSGIAPSDLSFNVIAENNKIYLVYC